MVRLICLTEFNKRIILKSWDDLKTSEVAIIALDCSLNNLTRIPVHKLPKTLKNINISNNKIKEIKNYPDHIEKIICLNNKMEKIINLPKNLKVLECCCNNLKKLPKLPKNLEVLWSTHNKLTTLPDMTNNIHLSSIQIDFNKIKKINLLPNWIKSFSCGFNKIKSFENIPRELVHFHCVNNNFTFFPDDLLGANNLTVINYSSNEIDLPVRQINFINMIRNREQHFDRRHRTIYNDSQNVHDSHMQKCLLKNILVLMKD